MEKKCSGDGLNKYSPCAFRDLLRRVEDLEEFMDAVKEYLAALQDVPMRHELLQEEAEG